MIIRMKTKIIDKDDDDDDGDGDDDDDDDDDDDGFDNATKCYVSTWWDMTSMEASAALAMVRSSNNSFQFTDELDEFPEPTFDLVESELDFRSELGF